VTMQHTPGPWAVRASHRQNACVSVVAGLTEVACLYGVSDPATRDAGGVWCEQPQRDIDARLIAAAPCVIETGAFLLDRIDDLDWSLRPEEFEREWHGHVEPALSRFRAAIARATGAA
jgi:hypothetical protein